MANDREREDPRPQMDEAAALAQNDLSEMVDLEALEKSHIAEWWEKWYRRTPDGKPGAGHKRLGRILIKGYKGGKMVKSTQRVEDEIYNQQYQWIKDKFGKEAAEKANYGWYVDTAGPELVVETKVYGHGVLVSRGSTEEDINHKFQGS